MNCPYFNNEKGRSKLYNFTEFSKEEIGYLTNTIFLEYSSKTKSRKEKISIKIFQNYIIQKINKEERKE